MPTAKSPTASGDGKDHSFKILSTRKGKFSLTVDCFIIVIVAVTILLIELGIFPHHQGGFYCQDPKLSFKFAGDTITVATLLISVYLIPLLIICGVEWRSFKELNGSVFSRSWYWYKEFLLGITVTLVLTEFVKIIVGEPRPHFFATCQPDTADNCTIEYISYYTCTNKDDRPWFVSDASKSFPSGHASMSVFAALFSVWYLQRCLPKMLCKLVKPLIQTFCLLLSVMCSLSRITDHRHHWWDVLAGATLGFLCVVYTLVVLCQNFKRSSLVPRSSQSTCTLLTDTTNKNATSVIL